MLSSLSDINELEILLEHYHTSVSVVRLIELYRTSRRNKEILDKLHILDNLVQRFNVKVNGPLTFRSFVEAANRACFGKGSLKYHTPNRCAKEIAKTGDIELIKFVVQKFTEEDDTEKTWYTILYNAAKGDHLNIVEYATNFLYDSSNKEGEEEVNEAIIREIRDNVGRGAARGGHIKLLDFIEERFGITGSSDYWINLSYEAARGGHLNLVKHAEAQVNVLENENKVLSWSTIASEAAIGGHTNVINYAIGKGDIDWSLLACSAAQSGSTEIFDFALLKQNNKVDWTQIAYSALVGDQLEFFDLALDKGAHNYHLIALGAVAGCHLELFIQTTLLGRKAYNPPGILIEHMCENVDMFKFIFGRIHRGQYDLESLYWFIREKYGNYEILDLIQARILEETRRREKAEEH